MKGKLPMNKLRNLRDNIEEMMVISAETAWFNMKDDIDERKRTTAMDIYLATQDMLKRNGLTVEAWEEMSRTSVFEEIDEIMYHEWDV